MYYKVLKLIVLNAIHIFECNQIVCFHDYDRMPISLYLINMQSRYIIGSYTIQKILYFLVLSG